MFALTTLSGEPFDTEYINSGTRLEFANMGDFEILGIQQGF